MMEWVAAYQNQTVDYLLDRYTLKQIGLKFYLGKKDRLREMKHQAILTAHALRGALT